MSTPLKTKTADEREAGVVQWVETYGMRRRSWFSHYQDSLQKLDEIHSDDLYKGAEKSK